MNRKNQIKLYWMAMFLGAFCAIELTTPIKFPMVYATSAQILPLPTLTPTPVPQYVNKYAGDKYADYIWAKWASHGNRAQAVALCTNIAEGHFDDSATHVNPGNGTDRGCWQWNDKYHPNVSEEVARNCFKATDLTYDTWVYRMSLGVTDGFEGMWYGYGSKNYKLCMQNVSRN